jgi:methylated-DNA-[protein]-cysteine S-methyltransferase
MTEFSDLVKGVVRNIPLGKILTYKEVADLAGNKKAARAVANIMAANFDENVPCHRVIRSDGKLGGYNRGGTVAKAKLLKKEGAII